MATIILDANPATVTLADTGENVIQWTADFNDVLVGVCVATIEVTTGTVNFNTMGNTAASGAAVASGSKIVVSFRPGSGISCKATTINDAFRVSF